jgi:hypothetical protein
MNGLDEEVVRQRESIVTAAETAVVLATCHVHQELFRAESSECSGDGVLGKIEAVGDAAY